MIHPGSELYGADRMFLLSLKTLISQYPLGRVVVYLPYPGPLVSEISKVSPDIHVIFRRMGILRKSDFSKLNFKALIDIVLFFRLIKLLSSYNLVYINTIVIADFLLASRWSGTRVITHVHELPVGISRYVFKKLVSFSRSELIYISQAVKDCFFNIGNPHQYILWNGIPEKKVNNQIKTNTSGERMHFLMVGRINAWKGQSLLVDAVSMLSATDKARIRVTILGDVYGNQIHFKERLIEQIEKNNLNQIFTLQSFQADTETFYSKADVVVVPSTLPEPFGLVALEAMRSQKAVIAADHGGLKEIVQDGVTGIHFCAGAADSLASSISYAVHHPNQIRDMGKSGYNRYRQYFTEEIYSGNLQKILSRDQKT